MFRRDAARTGFAPGSSVGNAVEEVWRLENFNTTDYGAAKGSASVADGIVYCGSDTGRFVAVDADTGTIVWEAQIEDTTQGIHGSPAIIGDLVHVGAYNGTIYSYNKDDGTPVWDFTLGFQIGSSPVVVPEWGALYSSHEKSDTGGGHLIAINARTGAPLWQWNIRAHPHSSVAVDVEREMVFVGDNLGIIHAWDATNGQKSWEIKLDPPTPEGGESDIKSTPTVVAQHGLVVFGAWSTRIHALDVSTGEEVWSYQTDARIMSSAAYAPTRDVVYVGGFDRKLHAVRAEDGVGVWTFDAGSGILSSPAVSGDEVAVLFGAYNGLLYAVNAEDGSERWTHQIGGRVTGSPTLVEDRVYVTAQGGDLVALRTYDE
jgi:outer membrane protein assembly factor BamB